MPRLTDLRWLQRWCKNQQIGFGTEREQVDRSRQTRKSQSPSPSRRSSIVSAIFFVSPLVCCPTFAQAPTHVTKTSPSVFVFLIRASDHVKFSSPQVFDEVVGDVYEFLDSRDVHLAIDEFAGRRTSKEEIPLESVLKIARGSGAESLLLLTVDRPMSKWILIEAKCYRTSGSLLWSFVADSGSSITGPITGGTGLRAALKALHKHLEEHIGKEGLPVKSGANDGRARKWGEGKERVSCGGVYHENTSD